MRQIVRRPPDKEGSAHESRKLPVFLALGESPPVEMVITAVWLLVPRVLVRITHPLTVLAVVKSKFALVEPFPMPTLVGTVNAGLLLVKATVDTPILGAVRVAVQLPEPPGETVEGVQLRPDSKAGSDKEMETVCDVPFSFAVTTALEGAANVPACAANEPEDTPLDTVIAPGTVSAALLLDNAIDAVVPGGTGLVRLTVQVVEACASSVPAAQVSEDIPAGMMREIVAVAAVPFKVPVKVAVWFAATVSVETLNEAAAAPADTVTDDGAVNAGEALFVNVTTAPPESAPSDRVTVHVAFAFEESVVAVQFSPVTVGGGSSDMVAVAAGPFRAPVKVAVWFAVTVPVEMVKVAVVAPAATATDAGTFRTAGALFVRVTTAPSGNAGFDSVTVHPALAFEERVVNVHASPETAGGVSSDMVAVAVDPLSVAVRVAVWFAVKVPVVMLNVAAATPPVTVTDAGAVNAGDPLLTNTTDAPPVDAGLDRVTVHVVPPFEERVVRLHNTPRMVSSGCSQMVAVAVVPFRAPVRVAVAYADSVPVEMLNVPVVAPAGTDTDAGAVKVPCALFVNVTTAPPASAGPEIVTVHVVPLFEDRVVNEHESPLTVAGGSSRMVAVAVVPFKAAVSAAVWFAVTVPVEMLNVPLAAPAAIVTDAGADNTGDALLVTATMAPPVSAPAERVTVQAVPAFDDNAVAVQLKPVTAGSGWSDMVAVAVDPFKLAVNVAGWFAVTVPVEMLNVPLTTPAAIVTDAGADNTGDALLVNATTSPPPDAARDSVTVHVVLLLDDRVVAVHETPRMVAGGSRDTVAVAVEPFNVAVRVAVWFAVTVPVEILNAALTDPAATVTDAGAVNIGAPLFVNVTTAPPAGAAADSVTVHEVLAFEDNVVAVQLNPPTPVAGCSDSLAVAEDPFNVAVRIAVWFASTVPVEILNAALTFPAATVTDAGAVNTGAPLLVSVTTAPPAGAAFDSVTVHDVLLLEASDVNVHAIPRGVGSVSSEMVAVAVPLNVAVKVTF